MTGLRRTKQRYDIEYAFTWFWSLKFRIYLEFGAWVLDFCHSMYQNIFFSTKRQKYTQ
jgi:hypothetical protein